MGLANRAEESFERGSEIPMRLIQAHFIFPLVCLSSCGSPLFDHSIKPKPSSDTTANPVRSSAPATDSSPSSSEPGSQIKMPVECVRKFKDTDLCYQIEFVEPPYFRMKPEGFSAHLLVWEQSRRTWAESMALDFIVHESPAACCPPPPIETRVIASGRFGLSRIEFHSAGFFDFHFHLRKSDGSILKGHWDVEVPAD